MRKFIILIVLVLIAGLGYLAYAHFSGGAVPTFGLAIGGEKAKIRARTFAFFEHVKFKNATALKNFVSKDVSPEEISQYMKKTLGTDAEGVDLTSVKIKNIELDSTNTRARVRVHLTGHDFVHDKPLSVTKIIFLYHPDKENWLVDVMNQS